MTSDRICFSALLLICSLKTVEGRRSVVDVGNLKCGGTL